ncbi:hypothetical protein QBC46DRAFT_368437 [Diplogelasinospora grovesii]|uniref:Uncharacterized protein n=1 Tax=Diplogelasinospora grovesii TaxID=303347 RepID=A0AAN6MV54_9PEZI|nr:hypothetical protein QBC46DRAFT_368437 [Diplogelasinospora grovesii]
MVYPFHALRAALILTVPTFNSAYINEKPTEDSLIGMLSHIGLMHDPRAPKIPPNPEILALKAERDRIRELIKLIAKKRAKHTKDIQRDKEEEEEYIELAIDLHIPERAELAEILYNQPEDLSSIKLLELRI